MEHRLSVRQPLNETSTIHCARVGSGKAKIRDMSLDGMLVETPLSLPLYASLTIVFSIQRNGAHQDFSLDAMVVRATKAGVGLMFDLEEQQFLILHDALEPTSFAA